MRIRSHARVHNLDHELRRSAVIAKYGAEADGLRKARQPDRPLQVPEGFEPAELPAEILKTYLLATEPPTFGSDQVQAEAAPSELLGVREKAQAHQARRSELQRRSAHCERTTVPNQACQEDCVCR